MSGSRTPQAFASIVVSHIFDRTFDGMNDQFFLIPALGSSPERKTRHAATEPSVPTML